MAGKLSAYRGCLLGMAVGDAFGDIVTEMTMEEILENYGPYGIMGYDPNSHGPEITAFTQVAAYTLNGILVGVERGKLRGDFLPEITMALREWIRLKSFPGDRDRCKCWVGHLECMRRKKNMENGAMFYLGQGMTPGSLSTRRNESNNPGLLTAAVTVGLAQQAGCIRKEEVATLGASIVALVYGHPMAHLSGAYLAVLVDRILDNPELPLKDHILQTLRELEQGEYTFRDKLPQFREQLEAMLQQAQMPQMEHSAYMEKLECFESHRVLLGALYACVTGFEDMDRALVTAVNHSGKSALVAALAGAILGAKLGEEALPEFYMEGLDAEQPLRELTGDLDECAKLDRRLFNFDWDRKYNSGRP